MTNSLYYGDNLDILREHVADASVDLIYLDPPFNSNATYNVLFQERSGEQSAAQITAFDDTWHWGLESETAYHEVVTGGPRGLADLLQAMRSFLGQNDMMAYLTMMSQRMIELHRVLKSTGSIYLHCDPTASHYLKMLLDAVFGAKNFRNEIVWKRTSVHNSARRYGPNYDSVLFFSRSDNFTWNRVYQRYDEEYINTFYRHKDDTGQYMLGDLTGAGVRHGDSGEPWRGVNPTEVGRHWAVPRAVVTEMLPNDADGLTSQEKLELLDKAGFVYWPPRGRIPRFKRYLNQTKGEMPAQAIWGDIPPVQAHAKERLGYPTQKPDALLERIVNASSNEGAWCWTPSAAAERPLPPPSGSRDVGLALILLTWQ